MRFCRFGIAICASMLSLGASFAQTTSPSADLVAKAKAEGKVVWYAAPGTRDAVKESFAVWQARYPGIQIEMVESSGPENMERIRAERRASRPVADLVSLGDIAAFQFASENAYRELDTQAMPNFKMLSAKLLPVLDPQRRHIPTYVQAYGIMVNSQIVSEADMPKRWTDLLNPKYSRKIGLHDFSRVGGGGVWLMIGLPALGEEFFKTLVKQQMRLFGRSQEMISAVARGERSIGIPGNSGGVADNPGAPLKLIYPEDGAFFISINTGAVALAPHPAAATLFLDFLLGPEAQALFSKEGNLPIRDDIPTKGLSLATAKFLGVGFQTPADAPKIKQVLDFGTKLLAP